MALLRMPAPAVQGDETEQLGLAVPEFNDVELAPVVYRTARAKAAAGKAAEWELMISATAVRGLLGGPGAAYTSASAMFAAAYGVLVDGVLLEVVSVTESERDGEAYVYRLKVKAPQAMVV